MSKKSEIERATLEKLRKESLFENKIADRMHDLVTSRRAIIHYLVDSKLCDDDWHGVADAANDLREIDTELRCLRWVLDLV